MTKSLFLFKMLLVTFFQQTKSNKSNIDGWGLLMCMYWWPHTLWLPRETEGPCQEGICEERHCGKSRQSAAQEECKDKVTASTARLLLCYANQLNHKCSNLHLLASQAICFCILCSTFNPKYRKASEMQNTGTTRPATEAVICCQPAMDAIRLPSVTTKHATMLF